MFRYDGDVAASPLAHCIEAAVQAALARFEIPAHRGDGYLLWKLSFPTPP